MFSTNRYDVIVAGGGLAGLYSAIHLARGGKRVLVVEKSHYPIEKVCGEYVSNEVRKLLSIVGFNPDSYHASAINNLVISDHAGKEYNSVLALGGFGISRTVFENSLRSIAENSGVEVVSDCKVDTVQRKGNEFVVTAGSTELVSNWVIGAFGKRSSLDRELHREFLNERTGFVGVKYHIRADLPKDQIALHSFPRGYCGIVKIEKDLYNVCYLFKRGSGEKISPQQIEEKYLSNNPKLQPFISYLGKTQDPVAISEIYFGKKEKEVNAVIFCGDAAGLITPLCGNGMAIAIHSAYLLAEEILSGSDFNVVTKNYSSKWNDHFAFRMQTGRILQYLFLHPFFNRMSLNAIFGIRGLDGFVINRTHNRRLINP